MSPALGPAESTALNDLLERINAGFRAADDQLVRVGLWLIEAQILVKASGQRWTKWVAANVVDRDIRQVQRCMALARAKDPAAAAEVERAKNRTNVAAHRARKDATYVSRIDPESIPGDRLHSEWWTPSSLFEKLGNPVFDLDPASPGANKSQVPALRHLTKADDGLTADWGDAFVWLNAPYAVSDGGMRPWLEKFTAHRNGIALVTIHWWQDFIHTHQDFIHPHAVLFPADRIQFIDGYTGKTRDTLGRVGAALIGVGDRAIEVLRVAAANGAGKLMLPEVSDDAAPTSPDGEGYWRVPPDLYKELNDEFCFEFDPCPYPRPEGFDGLEVPWAIRNFLNPAFVAANGKDGKGPIEWIRKAIDEQYFGRTTVMLLPVTAAQLDPMIRAGVEIRPIGTDGRVRWLHTRTGEPMPSPPVTIMFVFYGRSRLRNWHFSFDGARITRSAQDEPDVAPVVEDQPEPVIQDRPKAPVETDRRPAPRSKVRVGKYCALSTGCQYPRLCRDEGGCREANALSLMEA